MNETIIAMKSFGNLIIIELELWSVADNSYKPIYLTVDTGASITTLSHEILNQLGYEPLSIKKNRIITASGIEYISDFRIDKIKIGDIEISDVEVYAHNFPEESFSIGVIGLNVLQLFDVEFLFSKRLIKLKKIEGTW